MKNSTAKACAVIAIALYVAGASTALFGMFTNNIEILFTTPAIFLFGVIIHAIPEIRANQEINRTFNHC